MHEGQPGEGRREQVDEGHVGQHRAEQPDPEQAAGLAGGQGFSSNLSAWAISAS
jgi:hypothetical protein